MGDPPHRHRTYSGTVACSGPCCTGGSGGTNLDRKMTERLMIGVDSCKFIEIIVMSHVDRTCSI